jgi:poly(3-hydroxybutyrate) depolymerase
VLALTARVMAVFSVDRRRVHITGFSQGGYMTWRMLCRQPNLFASFAPLAASVQNELRDEESTDPPCVDSTTTLLAPRPVLYAHGTADALVYFPHAEEAFETLRMAWGLTEQETLDAGEQYEVVRYSGDGPAVIEMMRHDLRTDYEDEIFGAWEGHCFPGSDEPMGCGAGPAWGEAVLRFFEDHPKD